jgi:hypothetical protein
MHPSLRSEEWDGSPDILKKLHDSLRDTSIYIHETDMRLVVTYPSYENRGCGFHAKMAKPFSFGNASGIFMRRVCCELHHSCFHIEKGFESGCIALAGEKIGKGRFSDGRIIRLFHPAMFQIAKFDFQNRIL